MHAVPLLLCVLCSGTFRQYTGGIGLWQCRACPRDTVARSPGAKSCDACVAGVSWSHTTGGTECTSWCVGARRGAAARPPARLPQLLGLLTPATYMMPPPLRACSGNGKLVISATDPTKAQCCYRTGEMGVITKCNPAPNW